MEGYREWGFILSGQRSKGGWYQAWFHWREPCLEGRQSLGPEALRQVRWSLALCEAGSWGAHGQRSRQAGGAGVSLSPGGVRAPGWVEEPLAEAGRVGAPVYHSGCGRRPVDEAVMLGVPLSL